ncbi:MAG: M66 family metalloprotease [Massilia sp.]
MVSKAVAWSTALTLSTLLAGCGGGGSGSSATQGPAGDTQARPLTVSAIEFAQTHVLLEAGLSWSTAHDSQSLHLVGNRDALAMVDIAQTDVNAPQLQGWRNGVQLGSLPLNAPSALPATEAGGQAYASKRWSVSVPGSWMASGTQFKVVAANYTSSAAATPAIGLDSELALHVLPFYLFGANDVNTQAFAVTKAPSAAQQDELLAKLPLSKLQVDTVGRIDWSNLVVPPRADSAGLAQPAYVLTSMDQQKDGYAAMSAVLDLLGGIRSANGEGPTSNAYYAPLLAIDVASGRYHAPGGGLGTVGGGTAVADYSFGGATIHELGHAFGLQHAGGAYDDGSYPYPAGSLKGSVWGYDTVRKQFLDVLIPVGANSYANCANTRQRDAGGHCYKQDPMQGGAGDQAPGFAYTMFSDFYAGKIQHWFEGTTSINTDGSHAFDSGRFVPDAASASGYSRWDSIAKARVPVSATSTPNKGLYGSINQGLPIQTKVAVHVIAITMSKAGTPGATQIYPPLARTGSLVQMFDPTSPQDLQAIAANTGTYPWYCHASGCDYTVRVTYADRSQIHRVLSGGFRDWFKPTGAFSASTSDPISGTSFASWVINVPGSKAISKIELLDTPMVWNGMPAIPIVLASR